VTGDFAQTHGHARITDCEDQQGDWTELARDDDGGTVEGWCRIICGDVFAMVMEKYYNCPDELLVVDVMNKPISQNIILWNSDYQSGH
jgi:hypothetical protein